jgi:hypothetical protein
LVVSVSGGVVRKLLNFPGVHLVSRDFRVRDESTDPEKGSGELKPQALVESLSVTATGEETARHRGGDNGDKIEEDLDESRLQTAVTSRAPSFKEDTPVKRRLMARVWKSYLAPVFAPPSTALIVGLIVANVPPLKALFVQTDFKMPSAPDDKPPLDFLMDICNFGGDATPVLGMILLGAALSRMTIKGLPKGFWKSIVSMATLKLVVGRVEEFREGGFPLLTVEGPIIGLVWTTKVMSHTGLMDPDDKMLKFMMIMSAGGMHSTTQHRSDSIRFLIHPLQSPPLLCRFISPISTLPREALKCRHSQRKPYFWSQICRACY